MSSTKNYNKEYRTDGRTTRTSYMAKNVANDFIKEIMSKKKVDLRAIQVKNGYSVESARQNKAVRTKTFQDAVNPVIAMMDTVRKQALTELLRRGKEGLIKGEKFTALVDGVDKMTKNTQLLSGQATENVANNIVVFSDDDPLSKQLKV